MTDDDDRPDEDACSSPDPSAPEPTGGPHHPEVEASHPLNSAGPVESGAPRRTPTPLHVHSLRGDGSKLRARAIDTKPLLGDFLMHNQASMIYAAPNAGKTLTILRLIIEAIEEGRVDPDDVIYVNADDSGKGLADKVEIIERFGAHMIAPSYKGFRASQFADKLRQSAEDGSARGRVVLIDTLKKFTNLMDKGRSAEFANVCRETVMAGGTIIALGHTAKNRNPDGSPRYQGVTDILEDFDAVYVAEAMSGGSGGSERIIRFTQEKSRADSPQVSAYAYSIEAGVTYEDKLWSLRPVHPDELNDRALQAEELDDKEVIEAIRGYLVCGHGHVGQDRIVRAISADGDISRAQAERVLLKYTGSDPSKHKWNYSKGERRKRIYYLLRKPNQDQT